jgi:mono/diheme cytochrome c family protein
MLFRRVCRRGLEQVSSTRAGTGSDRRQGSALPGPHPTSTASRPVDLMRYAAKNRDTITLSRYGDLCAGCPTGPSAGQYPDPSTRGRYSDEQLYALAVYAYSPKPPANPNRREAVAARGQHILTREGCGGCHTPPLYTNDKLTPAAGFRVPEEHRTNTTFWT